MPYRHQHFNQNKFKHVHRLYILCIFTKLNVSYNRLLQTALVMEGWLDDGYKIDRWIHLSSTDFVGIF